MDSNRIIDELGGISAVARICDVTTSASAQWRHNGIPRARLMYLRLVRPDVFAKLESEQAGREDREAA